MNLELYLEKAMRKAGFHKYLAKEHMNAMRRIRLEADMGELSASETLIMQACVTPLDYGKAFLRLLCTSGLKQDYFGFSTRTLFTPHIKTYLDEMVGRHGLQSKRLEIMRKIPGHQIDHDLAREMVLKHGLSLKQLPEGCLDESLILKLLSESHKVVDQIPEGFMTEKIALKAVSRYGSNLRYIPEEFRTQEVSLAAFNNDPSCFYCFPAQFVTQEIAERAVMHSAGYIDTVPAQMITRNMALHAVSMLPRLIKHVPEHHLDDDFYKQCLAKNQEVFRHFPESLLNQPGILEECIERTRGAVLKSMRLADLTTERIKQCLSHDFMLIKNVPSHLIDQEIALHSASVRGEAVLFMPAEVLSPEVIAVATRSFPFALLKMDREALTDEIVMAAIREDYKVFATLPKELLTPEVLTEVIRQHGALLGQVSEDSRTAELCLIALEKSADAVPFIPPALRKDRVFMVAARKQLATLGLEETLNQKTSVSDGLGL